MEYRVVVYDSNGQQYKLYGKRKNLTYAEKLFNKLLTDNKVYFPCKILNQKSNHKELKFYLYLLKSKEIEDEKRVVRDNLGRLIKENFKNNIYSVLKKEEYEIEETFSVFGYKHRLKFKDIIQHLILNTDRIKYVFYFLNKLIIEDYDGLSIITCKTFKDSRRLHDTLLSFTKKTKVQKLVFMNHLKKSNRKRIYNEIKQTTKWSWYRIYRNTTRT